MIPGRRKQDVSGWGTYPASRLDGDGVTRFRKTYVSDDVYTISYPYISLHTVNDQNHEILRWSKITTTMASFTQLSASYYAIIRKEGKSQVLIFPAAKLQDFCDSLKSCLTDALERLEDPTLPDADYRVGNVVFKVSAVPETGAIRIDVREWYTDSVTNSLKPTRKGVNLTIEHLTTVHCEIESYISAEKENLARLASALTIKLDLTDDVQPPQAPSKKRKLKPKGARVNKKRGAAKKAKKGTTAADPVLVESDHETIDISSSDGEETE